jgi:hypothetical protein
MNDHKKKMVAPILSTIIYFRILLIIGSLTADEICIAQLIPERLKDQYCFRTNAALECLSFVESEKVWIN